MREALARLESDGLVQKVALRGYETTPLLTSGESERLHEFRLLLEPWMASEAAQHATLEQIEALKQEIVAVDRPRSEDVMEAWAQFRGHDALFHGLVAKI